MALGRGHGLGAVNTIAPFAAPGDAATPSAGQHVVLGVAGDRGVQQRVEAPRLEVVWIAPALSSRPSFTASTAKRTAGPGRLGVARLEHVGLPSSTVNSVSCMSP